MLGPHFWAYTRRLSYSTMPVALRDSKGSTKDLKTLNQHMHFVYFRNMHLTPMILHTRYCHLKPHGFGHLKSIANYGLLDQWLPPPHGSKVAAGCLRVWTRCKGDGIRFDVIWSICSKVWLLRKLESKNHSLLHQNFTHEAAWHWWLRLDPSHQCNAASMAPVWFARCREGG